MIRVLIVDDSEVDRKIISYALNKEEDIEIVGTAENPYVAKELIQVLKPDVITLDIQMPRMNGLTFLGKIMKHYPLPVIIVSSYSQKNSVNALKALRIGALDTLSKPGLEYNLKQFSTLLVDTIRGASKAKLKPVPERKRIPKKKNPVPVSSVNIKDVEQKIIAIGSSTGGTRALEYLLTNLPAGLPGIVIVQHLPESFTKSFAERLNKISALKVKEASNNEPVQGSTVYIAPGNQHMIVERKLNRFTLKIMGGKRVQYHRPSVDVLFKSVATLKAQSATGVILTGMGSDGAEGLLTMKENGAYTIGQDEKSSVIYGMPKAAFELGAVHEQLSLQQIPDRIIKQLSTRHSVKV